MSGSEHLSDEENAWDLIDSIAAQLRDDHDERGEPWEYQLTLDQLNSDIYETAKSFQQNSDFITAEEAEDFAQDNALRQAIRFVGEAKVREKYPLPPEEVEQVWERYPDGSTEEHVMMDEVDEALDRIGLEPDQVLLDVLDWHKAAQAVFSRRFKERFDL